MGLVDLCNKANSNDNYIRTYDIECGGGKHRPRRGQNSKRERVIKTGYYSPTAPTDFLFVNRLVSDMSPTDLRYKNKGDYIQQIDKKEQVYKHPPIQTLSAHESFCLICGVYNYEERFKKGIISIHI